MKERFKVAIVGRPNVGKSTLFNKLIGSRLSIVDDTPGVTRDRIYGECEWRNKKFLLIDTGGIEKVTDDVILSQMREQSEIAISIANVIILVTDVKTGVTATDEEVAHILKKSGKPVILCVNKCDTIGDSDLGIYEFYNLGLGDPMPVSSVHGHGTGDLLDAVFEYMPAETDEEENDKCIKVAIIGKPNVGKSSIINKIAGKNRCIVSDIAGTTRDSTDTLVSNEYGEFNLIDTAGIRRSNKIVDSVEKYSIIRAKMAIDRSDVCVMMIDAAQGFTEQDSKIAGLAHESGKACVIAVNKWDSIEKDSKTMQNTFNKLKNDFSFMSYAKIIFISAKTGLRLNVLFESIIEAKESSDTRISTGILNDILSMAITRVPPPTDRGKRLKIYYMTQASTNPPTFVCFVNSKELFHFSYQRYIENVIRDSYALVGTPIHLLIREKNEKKI